MKRRVLVVDDNPANLDLMLYLLGALGYDVDGAADGAAGWTKVCERSYDIVLCDVLMPVMDGYELVRRVRTLSPRPRVVAVTALAMPEDRERMLGAGFDAYLAKPIEPAALGAYLETVLRDGAGGARADDPGR